MSEMNALNLLTRGNFKVFLSVNPQPQKYAVVYDFTTRGALDNSVLYE